MPVLSKYLGWHITEGCTPVSAGCDRCYARAHILRRGDSFTPDFRHERLKIPYKLRGAVTIFVSPYGDLFHEHMPFKFIDSVLEVIKNTPQHTYHILTKRVDVMLRYFKHKGVPQNIWFGTSAENKEYGEPRIAALRTFRKRAAVLFISAEPFLGDLPGVDLSGIDWLSIAAERGKGARKVSTEAVRRLEEQCALYGVNLINTLGTEEVRWGVECCKYNKGDKDENITYSAGITINGSDCNPRKVRRPHTTSNPTCN